MYFFWLRWYFFFRCFWFPITRKSIAETRLASTTDKTTNNIVDQGLVGVKTLLGDRGKVLSIKDSVVVIEGLSDVKSNELVRFKVKRTSAEGPLFGVVLNLEYDIVKALTFAMRKFYVLVL